VKEPLFIVNGKRLVGDEESDDILIAGGAMLHQLSFGEPDETARTEVALVGNQCSLQNVHAMRAGVSVLGIQNARGIAKEGDFHAGVKIFQQILDEERCADLFKKEFFPGKGGGVMP
jgi:hypothetical protein